MCWDTHTIMLCLSHFLFSPAKSNHTMTPSHWPPTQKGREVRNRGKLVSWVLSLSLSLSRITKMLMNILEMRTPPPEVFQNPREWEDTSWSKAVTKKKKETGGARASYGLLLLIHKLSALNWTPRLKQGSWRLSNKTLAAVIWEKIKISF